MINQEEIILKELIDEYFVSNTPIGSLVLAKKIGVSSSNIRNKMLNLDKMGYLINKGSLGRIPSDIGYRYYYDNFAIENNIPIESVNIKIIPLKQIKIKAISINQIDNDNLILTVLFNTNYLISNIFKNSSLTNIDLLKINEIIKRSYSKTTISEVNLQFLNRYTDKSFYELLVKIISFLSTLPNFKIDYINMESLFNFKNGQELYNLLTNMDLVEKIFQLENRLFIGENEHKITEFKNFTIFKNNDIISLYNINMDYNALKYKCSKEQISEK